MAETGRSGERDVEPGGCGIWCGIWLTLPWNMIDDLRAVARRSGLNVERTAALLLAAAVKHAERDGATVRAPTEADGEIVKVSR